MILFLEAIASCLAIIGSVVVTSTVRQVRLAGFALWVVSNALFVATLSVDGRLHMAGMFLAFLASSLLGVIRNSKP